MKPIFEVDMNILLSIFETTQVVIVKGNKKH